MKRFKTILVLIALLVFATAGAKEGIHIHCEGGDSPALMNTSLELEDTYITTKCTADCSDSVFIVEQKYRHPDWWLKAFGKGFIIEMDGCGKMLIVRIDNEGGTLGLWAKAPDGDPIWIEGE